MERLKIGDTLWHPCNYDVIEHKIKGVREYEDFVQYETQAVRNVGASGRIQLLLSHRENKILFVGYVNGEESIYAESGLMDFVEGYYYTNKSEAEVVYYENQRILSWSSMNKHKQLYEQSKKNYDKVEKLVKDLKEKVKQLKLV